VDGRTFRQMFDSLPEAVQNSILKKLEEALLWRGWDLNHNAHNGVMYPEGCHAARLVQEIGDILTANGHEYPEYA